MRPGCPRDPPCISFCQPALKWIMERVSRLRATPKVQAFRCMLVLYMHVSIIFSFVPGYLPCVMTSIPAGFHLVLPFQPLTHILPRLTTGIVPSPSPNFTPDRTSGLLPLMVTAESIQCRRARGKSRAVRLTVELSHPLDGSEASH